MKAHSQDFADVPEVRDLAALQAQMQKPALHTNVDGGFELGWGAMLLCVGLVPYFNAAMPKAFWLSPWLAWMAYLPLLCMAFAPFVIPKLVKRFVTWPRIGYFANPNELKLKQLLMLMAFGLAIGFLVTRPVQLVWDIRELGSNPNPAGPHLGGGMRNAVLHGIELLVCAAFAVYLGRKVIQKRQPPPAAYDAALLAQRLKQSATGRKHLRVAKTALLLIFLGVPVALCGLVLGVMYLSKSVMRHTVINWPQFGVLSVVVVSNALLYLMVNGIALKKYRWKWLVLPLLLICPILVAPLIPYPTVKPELTPVLDLFPPAAMLFTGLAWFLSGTASLILFMRRNPLPSPETQ